MFEHITEINKLIQAYENSLTKLSLGFEYHDYKIAWYGTRVRICLIISDTSFRPVADSGANVVLAFGSHFPGFLAAHDAHLDAWAKDVLEKMQKVLKIK